MKGVWLYLWIKCCYSFQIWLKITKDQKMGSNKKIDFLNKKYMCSSSFNGEGVSFSV